MDQELEEYDIFTGIYEYNHLENVRKDDKAGLGVESYCEQLGLKYKEYTQYIVKLCKHFVNFSELYNVLGRISGNNKHKACGIINYWINSDIRDINNQILDLDFYSSLTEKINSNLNITGCSLNLRKIKNEEFDNLKTLYELYNHFYKMNGKIKTTPTSNTCEHYCTHQKNCINVYNTNIEKCFNNRNSKFCKELQNFSDKFISDNTCNPCQDIDKLKPLPPRVESDTVFSDGPAPAREINQHTLQSELHSTNNEKSIIIPTFTPLGTWLRLRIQRKKIVSDNICEETFNEFTNSEYNQFNYQNSEFNIQYHSVLNS
ncbi:Plasmodium vivax Vir protein, putative [Plasmodium ovale]|uniref:Plasmodium vivax Vir protein, putative n=1 Tax=Plasmodium ovale TaxID=36330 RepID=A0A1C3KK21_PLAOA|nr:Plasmodium vivax Vir protein, putative [Plasmodium ovale]